jgi:hypothetical protein
MTKDISVPLPSKLAGFGTVHSELSKKRLLNKATEANVSKAERIVRCICVLHNVIIDLEGTTHDLAVLHATSQISGYRHAIQNVRGQSFHRTSKEATYVKKCFQSIP